MKTLAVIPARAGSKGLPHKNIRPLNGKPLVAWSMEAAKKSKMIDRLICSTDSDQVMSIAKEHAVDTPFVRPAPLANDEAKILDVLKHALSEVEAPSEKFDYVCLIQPTSPFVLSEDIDKAIELAYLKQADTIISGYPCEQKHPSILFEIEKDHSVKWFADDHFRMARRQDLPTLYFRSGLVYVFRSELIREGKTLYGPKTFAVSVPGNRSLSIDTEDDLLFAEFLMSKKRG